MESNVVCLTYLKEKQTAVVKEILGGAAVIQRLDSLGIRPGRKISIISAHFWRGPVTIVAGKTKVAIGHGMARKIIVEVC